VGEAQRALEFVRDVGAVLDAGIGFVRQFVGQGTRAVPREIGTGDVGDVERRDPRFGGDVQRVADARMRARDIGERAAFLVEQQALCAFEDDPGVVRQDGWARRLRRTAELHGGVGEPLQRGVAGEPLGGLVVQGRDAQRGEAPGHMAVPDRGQPMQQVAGAMAQVRHGQREIGVEIACYGLAESHAAAAVAPVAAVAFGELVDQDVVQRRYRGAVVDKDLWCRHAGGPEGIDLPGKQDRMAHEVARQEGRRAGQRAAADMGKHMAHAVRRGDGMARLRAAVDARDDAVPSGRRHVVVGHQALAFVAVVGADDGVRSVPHVCSPWHRARQKRIIPSSACARPAGWVRSACATTADVSPDQLLATVSRSRPSLTSIADTTTSASRR